MPKSKTSQQVGAIGADTDLHTLSEDISFFEGVKRNPLMTLDAQGVAEYAALLKRTMPPQIHAEIIRDIARLYQQRDGETSSRVRVTCLALSMYPATVTYQMRPGACRLINHTGMGFVPTEVPKVLRYAAVMEARRPDAGERLFHDVVSLGWYWDDGEMIILARTYPPSNIFTFRWKPEWTGEDLPSHTSFDSTRLVMDAAKFSRIATGAIRFLITFAVLMQAENTQLRTEQENIHPKTKGAKSSKTPATMVIRHVYLSDPVPAKGSASTPVKSMATLDREDRMLAETVVRQHTRRQRYGPGLSLVREIVIREHDSHFWSSKLSKKIIVDE